MFDSNSIIIVIISGRVYQPSRLQQHKTPNPPGVRQSSMLYFIQFAKRSISSRHHSYMAGLLRVAPSPGRRHRTRDSLLPTCGGMDAMEGRTRRFPLCPEGDVGRWVAQSVMTRAARDRRDDAWMLAGTRPGRSSEQRAMARLRILCRVT